MSNDPFPSTLAEMGRSRPLSRADRRSILARKSRQTALSAKVALTKVYVPGHPSSTQDGTPYYVSGYWRNAKPGENLKGKTTQSPIPATTAVEKLIAKGQSSSPLTPVKPKVSIRPTETLTPKEVKVTRLESHVGGSSKFWEGDRDGTNVTVRFGKIGSVGQSKVFPHESETEAQSYLDKKIKEKRVKGYEPTGDAPASVVDTTVDVGIPDNVVPLVKSSGGSITAVTKNIDDLKAMAVKAGIDVPPGASKVDVMDLLRESLGTFDPSMQIDPAKAADLKLKIHWDRPGAEFTDIQDYLTEDWVAEPKLDGARFRMFLGKTGNTLNSGRRSSQTFSYTDRSDNFPQFRDLVVPELAGTILDGELMPPVNSIQIGTNKDGTPNMTQGSLNTIMAIMNIKPSESTARQNKYGKAVFVAFDVLAVKGEDVTGLKYEERRAMLEEIMSLLQAREPAMQMTVQLPASEDSIRASLDAGMEGVMLKRKDGKYVPGARMKTWQKVKRMSTGDFYIIGSIPGKGSNLNKVGSLKVAYRGADGEDVYVADVAGFDEAMRSKITDPDTGQVREEFIGKVIEVMGQSRTKNDRIRHPQFVRWRDDKTPEETDKTQLELFAPS